MRYSQNIALAPWLDWGTALAPPDVTPKIGWMIGDIEIDPFDSSKMMYGTGATIYGSDDLTAWDQSGGKISLSVRAEGLEETAVIDLVSPTEGATLLSALGDVGGFRHDDVTKVPKTIMTTPTFSTCTSIDYAAKMPNFVVRVGHADTAGGVKSIGLSYDGGANWFAPSAEPLLQGGGTVAVSADATTIVWSPGGGVVSHSQGGNQWSASSGIPAEARVGSDRVNPKKFYGFAAGVFYVSTDGGATFVASAAAGLPVTASFKALPGIEGDVWLAGGKKGEAYGLWHSTDAGATFTKTTTVEEADVVGFGKAAPGAAYMALFVSAKINGVRGIFRSDDSARTWTRLNDDRHQYGMTSQALTGDPRVYGRVYVGTNGRGIMYRDL
jgi:xyloglucan-specific exo-beta-1,4-glucanase